jgi:gamma-glutamyltranspeptidase/glutathione hydrolase
MADREYHFGDPAFVDVPIDTLLSDTHLTARVQEMDPVRAHPAMYPPLLGAGRAADGPVRHAPAPTPPRSRRALGWCRSS